MLACAMLEGVDASRFSDALVQAEGAVLDSGCFVFVNRL